MGKFWTTLLILCIVANLAYSQEDRVRRRGRRTQDRDNTEQQNQGRNNRNARGQAEDTAPTGTLTGKLVDQESGEGLESALIMIENLRLGTLTDFEGNFTLKNVPPGEQTIRLYYVGYVDTNITVNVAEGSNALGQLQLVPNAIGLKEIEVIAAVAKDRITPIATSSVDARMMTERLGAQEITQSMKLEPSVYTSRAGGGFGDSRIMIRGFQQEEVAVLINGIPINDMAAGRVFWSNWVGLTDVLRTTQIQRGLGASRLAINSIGGTINMITRTTDIEEGGSVTVETSNVYDFKSTVSASTGRMDNGMAATFVGSRTVGSGYIDRTFIDAWSYFFSLSKEFGRRHMLTFTAFGAPQRHGQRLSSLTTEQWEQKGNRFNPDWGYRYGEPTNVRVNFYHKPQVALNHNFQITDKALLTTSIYGSWGRGGGSGPLGSVRLNNDGPYGLENYGPLEEANTDGTDQVFDANGNLLFEGNRSFGILRNSWNNHDWYGVLSTFKQEIGENVRLMAGIDGRLYNSEHYRDVEDLIGGDFYVETGYAGDPQLLIQDDDGTQEVVNGRLAFNQDKVAYEYQTSINWFGGFSQFEYFTEQFSAFVSLAASNSWYQRFEVMQAEDGEDPSDLLSFLGYNAKAGLNFRLNENHNIYVNGGYFSRAPFFRYVFVNSRGSNETVEDPINETIMSGELGYGMRYGKLNLNLSGYYTLWQDKGFRVSYIQANGDPGFANIAGLEATHMGVELEGRYKIIKPLTLNFMASVGDWKWTNDVEGIVQDEITLEQDTVNLFLDGINVGDAAQTTASLGLRFQPIPRFYFIADVSYYDRLYADFDPTNRVEDTGEQPWEVPAFTLVDLHAGYLFKLGKLDAELRGHVNNVLDEEYIMEAQNGSENNEATSRVFYGFGRTFNIALEVKF